MAAMVSENERKLMELANELKDYSLFRTVVGKRYAQSKIKLMLVGRAANGLPSEDEGSFSMEKRTDFDWMNGYFNVWGNGLRRSSFWRVTGRVFAELCKGKQDDDWYENIVWTNLYRLTKTAGGNPCNAICKRQEKYCIGALKEDIARYAPTHILFITGTWFDAFAIDLRKRITGSDAIVLQSGFYANSRVVVSNRPERKPEDDYVRAVVECFDID